MRISAVLYDMSFIFNERQYKDLYTITFCNFLVPTSSIWWVILFQETGVVHRITYSFNYLFFTCCFIYSFYS